MLDAETLMVLKIHGLRNMNITLKQLVISRPMTSVRDFLDEGTIESASEHYEGLVQDNVLNNANFSLEDFLWCASVLETHTLALSRDFMQMLGIAITSIEAPGAEEDDQEQEETEIICLVL